MKHINIIRKFSPFNIGLVKKKEPIKLGDAAGYH